jgi:hypothetical protein
VLGGTVCARVCRVCLKVVEKIHPPYMRTHSFVYIFFH